MTEVSSKFCLFMTNNKKKNQNFRSYSFFFLVRAEFEPHIWMSGEAHSEIASLLLPFYCESLQKAQCLTKHRTKKAFDRSSDKMADC